LTSGHRSGVNNVSPVNLQPLNLILAAVTGTQYGAENLAFPAKDLLENKEDTS